MKHQKGKKGKHTTVLDGAFAFIQAVNRIPDLKVSNGEIKQGLPAAAHRVNLKALSACAQLTFRGTTSLQTFTIYGDYQYCRMQIESVAEKHHLLFKADE